MPFVRAVLCAAVVSLCGCIGAHFSDEMPSGVSLAGSWKLDRAASDDPQKVLAHMREEAMKLIKRQQAEIVARTGTVPGDTGDGPAPEGTPPAAAGQPPPRRDPLRHSPMAGVIRTTVERGDFLTVRQSPSEFVLDYGTSRRSFTPGAHSVVSVEGGVGDQNSGWHRGTYVIAIKPQMGSQVTEVYELSPDGQHLLEMLSIASGELPAVQLKRVYGRTTEAAPRQLPTND